MDTLRDAIAHNGPFVLALGGLAVGFLFGAVVFATNFCAMGSLSDIHNFGDWRRFRAWILAGAVALIGTQLLQAAGVVALDKSMYLASANSTGRATSWAACCSASAWCSPAAAPAATWREPVPATCARS